jgi:hypothetical protein
LRGLKVLHAKKACQKQNTLAYFEEKSFMTLTPCPEQAEILSLWVSLWAEFCQCLVWSNQKISAARKRSSVKAH